MMKAYFYNHQNLQSFVEEMQALVGSPLGTVNRVELCVTFAPLEWGRWATDIQELVRDYGGRLMHC